MSRPADCCAACGTQLQPLEAHTSYVAIARQECADAGIVYPQPLVLALVAHVAVVHDELDVLPDLVPFTPKGVKR